MNGIHLRLYTCENRKHGGVPLHDWLLERARHMGIHGGSAFRAIAGFGRQGKMHRSWSSSSLPASRRSSCWSCCGRNSCTCSTRCFRPNTA